MHLETESGAAQLHDFSTSRTQLASNIITPMVQRRIVTVPPALLLFAVLAFGLLFGTWG